MARDPVKFHVRLAHRSLLERNEQARHVRPRGFAVPDPTGPILRARAVPRMTVNAVPLRRCGSTPVRGDTLRPMGLQLTPTSPLVALLVQR